MHLSHIKVGSIGKIMKNDWEAQVLYRGVSQNCYLHTICSYCMAQYSLRRVKRKVSTSLSEKLVSFLSPSKCKQLKSQEIK